MSVQLWIVDAYYPDYPVEFESAEQVKEMASEHSQIIIYADKKEALTAARRFIKQRLGTMYQEGMEDREYDRSYDWSCELIRAIDCELKYGEEPDFDEIWADLVTMRHERGEW